MLFLCAFHKREYPGKTSNLCNQISREAVRGAKGLEQQRKRGAGGADAGESHTASPADQPSPAGVRGPEPSTRFWFWKEAFVAFSLLLQKCFRPFFIKELWRGGVSTCSPTGCAECLALWIKLGH